ncbi:hypothetical protein [Clostridium cellulovorans]|uniref:Uncharacterized protein n=1 Tax=Clostridium cellulovorans (strain ATCC 35296 / DSM 3052 / OCM 3 / 743B) TaxID=573061 RepID=D9SUG8_CLOC7|nr:hypothetical protein [Clostridium cellulovorans]ADL52923.1 hypothetical protein Clocel_3237 [Clostridium cellulovorans 743B]
MVLILVSLITAGIGSYIGGRLGNTEIFSYLFGFIGFLCPGIYVLEKIYIKVNKE